MALRSTEPGTPHRVSFYHTCGAKLVDAADVNRIIGRDKGEHTVVWATSAVVRVGKRLGANASKSSRQVFQAGDDDEAAEVVYHEILCERCGENLRGAAVENMVLYPAVDPTPPGVFVYKLRVVGAKWSGDTVVARPYSYRCLRYEWEGGQTRNTPLRHIRPLHVNVEDLPRRRADAERKEQFPLPSAQGRGAGLSEAGMDATADAAVRARGKLNRKHPVVVACLADHDGDLDSLREARVIRKGVSDDRGVQAQAVELLPATTAGDLGRLEELRPRVLYIGGHGAEDLFCVRGPSAAMGTEAVVWLEDLAAVLEATPSVELVFFGSCHSYEFARQLHELRPEIGCLGWTDAVDDDVAIAAAGVVFDLLWRSNAKLVQLTKFVEDALREAEHVTAGSEAKLRAVMPTRRHEACVIHVCDVKGAGQETGGWLRALHAEARHRLLDHCRMLERGERVDRVCHEETGADVTEDEARVMLQENRPVRLAVVVAIEPRG
jgi:hypothetical protein